MSESAQIVEDPQEGSEEKQTGTLLFLQEWVGIVDLGGIGRDRLGYCVVVGQTIGNVMYKLM